MRTKCNTKCNTKLIPLYSSLQNQPTFEYDETGKITGYKTKVGADTVFPFSSVNKVTIKGICIYNTYYGNTEILDVTIDVKSNIHTVSITSKGGNKVDDTISNKGTLTIS